MIDKTCRQCGKPILIGEDRLCADCVRLRDFPDGLSKVTKIGSTPFRDMKQLDEVARFKLIAEHLKANPAKVVALFVECDAQNKGKGDRYIAGVQKELPSATVVSRSPGPVAETETIKFKLEPK